ncbi:MAG: transglutaminase domain-containing protein [Limnoraphis robusta]|uniref:Transglutaminase n=1 Tax=Limnoraphis robusta CS-951 TaxID=1637645 RepID=A0A0F5YDF8_9CYAN|nr:transglutaminase domain-containing protein [Limnoraphis robusta]KKD36662.1 transglutaminase [Limnoraphis robusta CS-951]
MTVSPNLDKNSRLIARTIRPIGVSALHGIAFLGETLFAIDRLRGFLLKVDPKTDNTTIVNPYLVSEFTDVTGLAIWENTLWYTRDERVYFCENALQEDRVVNLAPELFATLPYEAEGIAVWQSTVYVSCAKLGYIFVFNRETGREITRFYAPGIGRENLTVYDEELWVCDQIEQTVYCLERGTGKTKFSVLTPFEFPCGLGFYRDENTGEKVLYVAYSGDELYIRDDPNSEEQYQLARRDRTFIHPLYYHYNQQERYATSNGYLIEMSYIEELEPLDEVILEDVEWRIALPSETNRQKIREITPIGVPFTEEIQDGERVAVFKFKPFNSKERRIFGWKALLEVRAIKYQLNPWDVEDIQPLTPDFRAKYLVDDDNLAMESATVLNAAHEAVRNETNILRKLRSIRDYVYDQLSYSLTSKIETPDVVLKRGVGSCGEYVGALLALGRLNGIACRTVGRYKCPPFPEQKNIPLQAEYNHVWLEFYIPGFGWVPMESNPDDIQDNGPYPLRFFMGLAWYHVEIGKGIRFQQLRNQGLPVNKEEASVGNLAINHVRFMILEELPAD